MRLTPSVLGAEVAYLKNVVPRGLGFSERQVLLFGICHLHCEGYRDALTGKILKYFPNWIGQLARSAEMSRKTAVLVECPPFGPEAIALPKEEFVKLSGVELKISDTLGRVQKHFLETGAARQQGWVLQGIDLRYLCEVKEGKFVPGDKGVRHSLHEDAQEGVQDAWHPLPRVLEKFYAYLVGLSDETSAFEEVAGAVKALTRGRADERREVLERAAVTCRALFAGVPEPLRRELIRHLIKEGLQSAELAEEGTYDDLEAAERDWGKEGLQQALQMGMLKVRTTDYESRPNSENTVKNLVAEHLVNLCIFGHIFSPGSDVTNIVVAVGSAHVATVVRFFASPAIKTLVKLSSQGSILKRDFAVRAPLEDFIPRPVDLA